MKLFLPDSSAYKYCPAYPGHFESLEYARSWTLDFIHWYNCKHRHSAIIKFVTPQQKHSGKDIHLLRKRQQTYQQAKAKHPGRWTRKIRNWSPVEAVHLNPASSNGKISLAAAA